jgi:hypothetical protein
MSREIFAGPSLAFWLRHSLPQRANLQPQAISLRHKLMQFPHRFGNAR